MFLGCVDDHAGLPHGRQPRRGLRDRGHRDDGDHDPGLRLRRPLPLGLAALEGARRLRADPGGGPALLRQQPPEVHARRLLPRGDRRGAGDGHAHLAVGPGPARQGVLRLRRPGGEEGPLAGRPPRQGRRDPALDRGEPAAGPGPGAGEAAAGRDRPRLRLPLLAADPRPRRVPPGLAPHLPQEVRRPAGAHHPLPRQPGLGGRGARGARTSR